MSRSRPLALAAAVIFFVVVPANAEPRTIKAVMYDQGDDFARLMSTDGHSTLFLCFFADKKSVENLQVGQQVTIWGKQLIGRQEAILTYGAPFLLMKDCRVVEDRKQTNAAGTGNPGSPAGQEQPSGKGSAGGKDSKEGTVEHPLGKADKEDRRDKSEETRDERRERERREDNREATRDPDKKIDDYRRREEDLRRREEELRRREEELRREKERGREEEPIREVKKGDGDRKRESGILPGQPVRKPGTTAPPSNRMPVVSQQMMNFQQLLAKQHDTLRAIAMPTHSTAQPQLQPLRQSR
jgi:hypothetical protein